MSFKHVGGDVQVLTSGIIHVSGTQYYVSCAEGDTNTSTSITVSCLTVSPHTSASPYPDGGAATWYYLSAPGHTISIPSVATNSTEVLLLSGHSTITVSC
jgi:hypothetical protein